MNHNINEGQMSYQEVNPILPFDNTKYLHIEGDIIGNHQRQLLGITTHPDPFMQNQIDIAQILNEISNSTYTVTVTPNSLR